MHRKLRTLQFTMGLLVCLPKPVVFVPLVVRSQYTVTDVPVLLCSVLFFRYHTVSHIYTAGVMAVWTFFFRRHRIYE